MTPELRELQARIEATIDRIGVRGRCDRMRRGRKKLERMKNTVVYTSLFPPETRATMAELAEATKVLTRAWGIPMGKVSGNGNS